MSNRLFLLAKVILQPQFLSPIRNVFKNIRYRYGEKSYSQEGEDRVLARLLFKLHGGQSSNSGFYIDIGAHHPHRFSNTFLFYKEGWRGINIDAMPGSMRIFRKMRPRDTNLEIGVGKESSSMSFYIFNEPALNTFDSTLAEARNVGDWHVKSVVNVEVEPLSKILSEYVPDGETIDFMTIDVEGLDLDVIQSNDWKKFRPLVVLAETLDKSMEELVSDPLVCFMRNQDYVLYAKTVNTSFFVDKNQFHE